MWPQEEIQLVAYDAGLYPHPFFFSVEFQDTGEVFGNVRYDALADDLSRKRSAGRAGDQGGLFRPGESDEFFYVGHRPGDGDCQRHFPVSGCVGGIQCAHGLVVIKFAFQFTG